MMRPRYINGAKPPLLVEHEGGGRGRERNAEALRSLCRGEGREALAGLLLEAGAVLLRGFGPLEPAEFGRFARDFSGRAPLDYVGGASPRVKVCWGVYTSTEYPRHYTLSLHNELSYTYRWPEHLYFYCDTPAAEMSLFGWRAGDLLVADNVLAAHGRMPFSGARRVLLSMT